MLGPQCNLPGLRDSVGVLWALPQWVIHGTPYTTTGDASAAADTGFASQTVTITWQAAIPANVYVGTYTSTWTLTLASGP